MMASSFGKARLFFSLVGWACFLCPRATTSILTTEPSDSSRHNTFQTFSGDHRARGHKKHAHPTRLVSQWAWVSIPFINRSRFNQPHVGSHNRTYVRVSIPFINRSRFNRETNSDTTWEFHVSIPFINRSRFNAHRKAQEAYYDSFNPVHKPVTFQQTLQSGEMGGV